MTTWTCDDCGKPFTVEGLTGFFCPECRRKRIAAQNKTTNADRIRAMSDAELAEIISANILTGACNDFGIPGENPCPHNCKKCVLKWLQQKAE